ncbi:MAG TPA: FAD-binding oxidoreductase [Flavobacteriia bacterium]|nr:FAD-binding oxidoreductase [Flavobacteriia bacterium]
MKVDYIVVGLGLAGISFIERLKEHHKSFVVFENNSQNASKVASGLFNPVILKRFTPVWQGTEQIEKAIPFYKKLEKKLNTKLIQYLDIKKSFKTIEEQNNWYLACDNPFLKNYLSTKIESNDNPSIIAPKGLGKVINCGKVDTVKLIEKYKKYISKQLVRETFEHDKIQIENSTITYKNSTAKHIVFCEGFGIKGNPFFNQLPLKEAKGELLEIKSNDLNIDYVLKSAVFIMPLKNNNYKVGATFNWKDKTNLPTTSGKNELVEKLAKTINCTYQITNQFAGIRPTVKDRRPLIGTHHKYKNMHLLNGLGTRGVMLAPTLSEKLFLAIEKDRKIEKEINLSRFL